MKKGYAVLLFFLCLNYFSYASAPLSADTSQKKNLNFFPIPILLHSPETFWGFGAGSVFTFRLNRKDTALRTSNATVLGIYTLKKQLITASEGTIFLPKEKYIIRWQASFTRYPDLFWGTGNNSPDSAAEDYAFTQYYVHPEMVRKLHRNFYSGLSYEHQNVLKTDYIAGGLFDRQNIAGKDGGVTSGAGVLLAWDKRNNAFSPDQGEFLQLYASHFSRYIGSDFSYSNYFLDMRKYVLTLHSQVLVVQAVSQYTTGNVPFRSMAALGGASIMRGYYQGRFRDKCMSAFQTEYRIPLWKRLGIALFSGMGEVAGKLKYYSMSGFHYSFGGGIRYALKKKDRLNIRLDYGKGNHSDGVYFLISEAF
ncbi:MAG: BamA/TamA family outer membrane protein [Bacteroidetes bacterium]|nr:BamA/TamA family outer membrane protein [Bacteroidota bacterium]